MKMFGTNVDCAPQLSKKMMLLLLAATAPSRTVARDACEDIADTDYSGGDLRKPDNAPYETCKTLCAADPECEGMVTSTTDECWLKNSMGTATGTTGRVSLKMTDECRSEVVANSPKKCLLEEATNHSGGNQRMVSATMTLEKCKEYCAADPLCVGLGFYDDTDCWLKNSWETAKNDDPSRALLMTDECRAEILEEAYDDTGASLLWMSRRRSARRSACVLEEMTRHGGSIISSASRTYDECLEDCFADPDCLGINKVKSGSDWTTAYYCYTRSTWDMGVNYSTYYSVRMSDECRAEMQAIKDGGSVWKLNLFQDATNMQAASATNLVKGLAAAESDEDAGKLAFRLAIAKMGALTSTLGLSR